MSHKVKTFYVYMRRLDPNFVKKNQTWLPQANLRRKVVRSDSWFNISKYGNLTNLTKIPKLVEAIRTKDIQIYPTEHQKHILVNWFEIYRQIYNITVKYFKNNQITSFITARKNIDQIINQKPVLVGLIKRFKIPKHTRDNVINDYIKAINAAFANKQAGNILGFKMLYKKKQHHIKTLVLEQNTFSKKQTGFCVSILGNMKSSEKFINVINDCRLFYNTRTNKIIVKVPINYLVSTTTYKSDIVALDPGMRCFQTAYSPDKCIYEFNNTQCITNIINRIDKAKDGKNVNKFKQRLRERISNLVSDLHWKTANFLCRRYKTILLGNMSTTGIVCKETSFMTPMQKKYCLALSHYTFRQRLQSKAEEYGSICLIVDESYTTKTCGKCCEINNNVGGDKTFTCTKSTCNFKINRDWNGARNILMKAKQLKNV